MNRDDIIRMAREAQFSGMEICGDHDCDVVGNVDDLERFAALVATAERERCINILKTTYIIDDGEDFVQLVLDRINHD